MKNSSIMYGVLFLLMGLFVYTNCSAMESANQPLQAIRNSSDQSLANSYSGCGFLSASIGLVIKLAFPLTTVDQRGVTDEHYQCDCDYGWFPACNKVYYCSDQSIKGQECCPCFCNSVAYSSSGCVLCGGLCVGSGLLITCFNLFKNYKERGGCCIWD